MTAFATFEILMPICISIIFTIVAINREQDQLYWSLLAGVCWFVSTVAWFIFALDNSGTFALTFLWLGLGIIFTVRGIQSFFSLKKEKRLSFDSW